MHFKIVKSGWCYKTNRTAVKISRKFAHFCIRLHFFTSVSDLELELDPPTPDQMMVSEPEQQSPGSGSV
jgi:hypothetical protein